MDCISERVVVDDNDIDKGEITLSFKFCCIYIDLYIYKKQFKYNIIYIHSYMYMYIKISVKIYSQNNLHLWILL